MENIWLYLVTAFSQFRWLDVLDILFVTVIIYKFIMLAKETRAYQLLRGLIILLVSFGLCYILGLTAMTYIMMYIFGAGAVVLVVIFQYELRRMLDKLGRGRFFFNTDLKLQPGNDLKKREAVIEELLSAVQHLAKRRVGALIVLQRATALSEVVESGVRMDARVGSLLIENIFEPNTPLHDGAVVIADGRLAAAACFLPLTSRNDLPNELGTRHRAAIGMTENSDAMVLVVSEETGIISVALNGYLERNIDTLTLRKRLVSVFIPAAQGSESNWKKLLQQKEEKKV